MCSARKHKPYKIISVYDTETTTVGNGPDSVAFPILFIASDLRGVDLKSYDATEPVYFYRHENEYRQFIDELIAWGFDNELIPVVCAYNLMFDLQPIIYGLSNDYDIQANAQSSTHVYTLDLLLDGVPVLRFWDTFHLEMRGLAAMGATCGLDKASGDWDYKLIRTPDTPLTDLELFYAKRDVQVIPAYLKWLLSTNEWVKESDFAYRIVTKTSLVRQQARHEIGGLKVAVKGGRKISLQRLFMQTCRTEFPRSYAQYALRKACFKGGYTFTAGAFASQVQRRVISLDETSAHHAFINGRLLPVKFRGVAPNVLQSWVDQTITYEIEDVLNTYHIPLPFAYHARVRIKNIRLKVGSAFDAYQIALIPEGKFRQSGARAEWGDSEANMIAEQEIRVNGYNDAALNPLFAYGKLMQASEIVMHVNELEMWTISRVYDFDNVTVIFGEGSNSFVVPPDYVTMQSNMLFERKQAMKRLLANYTEGVRYTDEIPESIPEGIAADVRSGTASIVDLTGYYNSTVKGMFNGIYGVHAQDLLKPTYKCINGVLEVDRETVCTRENFEEKKPSKPKSIYTYGMRIVGGSRLQIVIAIELIYRSLPEGVRILGGDTDSLKIALCDGVSEKDVLHALEPLHMATTRAIDTVQSRVRSEFPDIASTLDEVGTFGYEGVNDYHMEAWNKARVSMNNGRVHVTCAGLPRPKGRYTIETWIEERLKKGGRFEELAPYALGYNVLVNNDVCHVLERTSPRPCEVVDMEVTDYLGKKSQVRAHKSIALYDGGRYLGDTTKRTNAENVAYLRYRGIEVRTDEREVNKNE